MAPRVDNSERAEQLIHNYYDYLSKTPWIAPIVSTYENAKHSHSAVESGLGKVEKNVITVSTLLIAMGLWSINTFYVVPVTRVKDGTRRAIDWTNGAVKRVGNWMVNLGTLSIGIAVVSVQAMLTISIGGASIGLDGVEIVKRKTTEGVEWTRKTGREVKDSIARQIDWTVRTVMIPINMLTDSLHCLLDLIQGFVDNKMEMRVEVAPDASLLTRIRSILTAISSGLSQRAHSHVIDPAHSQLEALVEQTKKSLVVLEVIREKGEWAVEKVEDMSNAVSQWKAKMEEEARQYRVSPEVILLKAIHSSTEALTHNILTLKQKNSKVFGDVALFDGVLHHLDSMTSSLKDKRDIYEVRDEIIQQSYQSLTKITNTLIRKNSV